MPASSTNSADFLPAVLVRGAEVAACFGALGLVGGLRSLKMSPAFRNSRGLVDKAATLSALRIVAVVMLLGGLLQCAELLLTDPYDESSVMWGRFNSAKKRYGRVEKWAGNGNGGASPVSIALTVISVEGSAYDVVLRCFMLISAISFALHLALISFSKKSEPPSEPLEKKDKDEAKAAAASFPSWFSSFCAGALVTAMLLGVLKCGSILGLDPFREAAKVQQCESRAPKGLVHLVEFFLLAAAPALAALPSFRFVVICKAVSGALILLSLHFRGNLFELPFGPNDIRYYVSLFCRVSFALNFIVTFTSIVPSFVLKNRNHVMVITALLASGVAYAGQSLDPWSEHDQGVIIQYSAVVVVGVVLCTVLVGGMPSMSVALVLGSYLSRYYYGA